jgi:hypothetical protein
MASLTLSSKLGHEITERAIAITELPSNLGQRAMVEKDGSERLEASVECRGGTSEEVVAASVVHGVSSRIVTEFSAIPHSEETLFHIELARYDQVSAEKKA